MPRSAKNSCCFPSSISRPLHPTGHRAPYLCAKGRPKPASTQGWCRTMCDGASYRFAPTTMPAKWPMRPCAMAAMQPRQSRRCFRTTGSPISTCITLSGDASPVSLTGASRRSSDVRFSGGRHSVSELPCVDILYEADEPGHVDFLIIVDRKMTAIRAVKVAPMANAVGDLLHLCRLHGVVARPDGEGRHGDPAQVGGAVPIGKLAAGAHFARPLHRDVDFLIDFAEPAHYRVRPLGGRHAQEMLIVEIAEQQFLVARIPIFAGRLEALDFGQDFWIHGRHQDFPGVAVVRRNTRYHVRNNEAFEVLLVLERVFQGEHSAPGMTQQIEISLVELECLTHLLDFLDEARERPQVRLVRLVAIGRT